MALEIRTRIAPSPTGPFHLGNARAALLNYLFSKKTGGKFILRIEDTDKVRSKEEYVLDIEKALTWLGLGWDEGPETPDVYGPYEQSKRGKIYDRYIKKLLEKKKAYYCFCTPQELEAERKEQEARHEAPKYSGKCRNLSPEQIKKYQAEGRKPAIRFLINTEDTIKYTDLIHGKIEFDPKLFGDFIIVRSDGQPIFLFTGVVDDGEMKISHVIRGDDHLSNTPKQIMLTEAMDLPVPEYGHLPLILNPDRSKLSKRKNPVSVTGDFMEKGYLPEAMINFMAFLGWTPKINKEFFTLDELVSEFDLENVGSSPAVFDQKKLDFYNGYYIRKLALGDLAKRCLPYLIEAGLVKKENEKVLAAVSLVQERMKNLAEVPDLTDFCFRKPKYQAKLLITKKSTLDITKKALEESYKYLEKEEDYSRDSIEQLLRALAGKMKIDSGKLLWPIRVALTGREASPGVFELIDVLGKSETLERIKIAIDMLQ